LEWAENDTKLLEWTDKDRIRCCVGWAAGAGRLETVKWLRERGGKETWDKCKALARATLGGHVEILTWAEEEGLLPPEYRRSSFQTFLRGPFIRGNQNMSLEALMWLWERNFRFTISEIGDLCARGGHLHVLQWLWEEEGGRGVNPEWIFKNLALAAAFSGHVEVLKWIMKMVPQIEFTAPEFLLKVARKGHLGVMKFLEEKGYPVTEEHYHVAAKSGHLGVLRWGMEERGWRGCEKVCEAAARRGDLEFLKWARERGCPWDHMVYVMAGARGGGGERLEILEWAREEGCPWDGRAPTEAVKEGGSRAIFFLEWVWETELEVDEEALVEVIKVTGEKLIPWVLGKGGWRSWSGRGRRKAFSKEDEEEEEG
jgi:hypothetical protein